MAVDLTVAALAAALRLGASAEETAEATRLLGYATTAVETYAPAAPANVQNEAVIRLAGYLFDQPLASRGAAYANAARNSGALRMLLPYRIHRAGSTAEATAAAQAGAVPAAPAAGGGIILLAGTEQPPSRNPGSDPNGTGFIRRIGLSGYSPVTQADIDQANPVFGGSPRRRGVFDLANWRGGNYGNTSIARDNSLSLEAATWLGYDYAVPAFLFALLGETDAESLFIESVSQNAVDIPGARQAGTVEVIGRTQSVWVSDRAYSQAEIDAGEFILAIGSTGPATFNRYIVVTQSPIPTPADFTAAGAQTGASSTVRVPNAGWRGGQGFVHIALPAGQPAPSVIGEVGEPNLRDYFQTGNDIEINGDAMQTISTKALIYMPRAAPLWLIE